MPGPRSRAATLSKPESAIGRLVRISLVLVVGCTALAWGGLSAKRGAASDVFRDIETHLLKFETFSPASAAATLDGAAAQKLNACDAHAQRALLLLEIPLAYFLAITLGAKQTGVYWSIVVAESMAGIVAIFLFRRGKWKQIKL